MSDPERKPDVDAAAALALIQAENDYRSAIVGPVSPDALPLLQAGHSEDAAAGAAAASGPGDERAR